MAKSLEPYERKAAAERQSKAGPTTGRGAKASGPVNFTEPVKGRASDKIADNVSWSPSAAACTPPRQLSWRRCCSGSLGLWLPGG